MFRTMRNFVPSQTQWKLCFTFLVILILKKPCLSKEILIWKDIRNLALRNTLFVLIFAGINFSASQVKDDLRVLILLHKKMS